jgi:YD repeat-containing protein
VQYDYNDAGRLLHLTYPGGKVVAYGYDRDGRLKPVQGD